jgi:hypothetical protein
MRTTASYCEVSDETLRNTAELREPVVIEIFKVRHGAKSKTLFSKSCSKL